MKKLIVANWKMNLGTDEGLGFASFLVEAVPSPSGITPIICPPDILLREMGPLLPPAWHLGAQDCSAHKDGPFTGEISATMLASAGCSFVLVGHSERRFFHHETGGIIAEKAQAALEAGLRPIVCVGETKDERDKGRAIEVIAGQLNDLGEILSECIIAYEPRWAIGTGSTPSLDEIAHVHQALSDAQVPLLYGGSVDLTNALSILEISHVDGLLIGGASLQPTFIGLLQAANRAWPSYG